MDESHLCEDPRAPVTQEIILKLFADIEFTDDFNPKRVKLHDSVVTKLLTAGTRLRSYIFKHHSTSTLHSPPILG